MTTYVLAWNPRLWNWPGLPRDIARLRRRGHVDLEWSCGRTRNLEPGSRAFFIRLGVAPKGLIGSGYTLTAPVSGPHWLPEKRARGVTTHHLRLRLDVLAELPVIAIDELARPPFGRFRWAIRQSGMRLPSALADSLEPWWEARVAAAREARPPRLTKRAGLA